MAQHPALDARHRHAIGDEVFYTLNMGSHWEARGPARILGFRDQGGFASLSDSIATYVDPKYLHASYSTAFHAAAQLTKLRRA